MRSYHSYNALSSISTAYAIVRDLISHSIQQVAAPSKLAMKLIGKCLCGGVRCSVVPKALHAEACHCNMCQTWHGSVGMSIALEGPPVFHMGEDLVQIYKSSEHGQRCFCKVCGTGLGFQSPAYGYYGISPGVLEKKARDALTFTKEIFIDEKPKYFSFAGDDDRPTMTEAEFLAQFQPAITDDTVTNKTV